MGLLVGGHLPAFAGGEDADDGGRSFVWLVAVDEQVRVVTLAVYAPM
jgi:hypothetical protein